MSYADNFVMASSSSSSNSKKKKLIESEAESSEEEMEFDDGASQCSMDSVMTPMKGTKEDFEETFKGVTTGVFGAPSLVGCDFDAFKERVTKLKAEGKKESFPMYTHVISIMHAEENKSVENGVKWESLDDMRTLYSDLGYKKWYRDGQPPAKKQRTSSKGFNFSRSTVVVDDGEESPEEETGVTAFDFLKKADLGYVKGLDLVLQGLTPGGTASKKQPGRMLYESEDNLKAMAPKAAFKWLVENKALLTSGRTTSYKAAGKGNTEALPVENASLVLSDEEMPPIEDGRVYWKEHVINEEALVNHVQDLPNLETLQRKLGVSDSDEPAFDVFKKIAMKCGGRFLKLKKNRDAVEKDEDGGNIYTKEMLPEMRSTFIKLLQVLKVI